MGKRGPKKGEGGRPRGGRYSEVQREIWRKKKQLQIEQHKKRREWLLNNANYQAASESFLEVVRAFPDYKKLTPEQQKSVEEKALKMQLDRTVKLLAKMDEQWEETEQYWLHVRTPQLIEQVTKEREQFLEAELRRVLAPILSLPYEERVKVFERLMATLYGAQKQVEVTKA